MLHNRNKIRASEIPKQISECQQQNWRDEEKYNRTAGVKETEQLFLFRLVFSRLVASSNSLSLVDGTTVNAINVQSILITVGALRTHRL